MLSLRLLVLPLVLGLCWLSGCAEKDSLTLAATDDNFIEGVLEGKAFRYDAPPASINGGVLSENHTRVENAFAQMVSLTLVRGSSEAGRSLCLNLTYSTDPKQNFPFDSNTIGPSFADFMVATESVLNPRLERRIPVEITVTDWSAGDRMTGTFVSEDGGMTGSFSVLLPREF